MAEMEVHHLGLVEYEDGLQLQKLFGEARASGLVPDSLLLLEHPPVLTLGRAGKRENIVAPPEGLARLGVEVFETNRGGDVTYHGPGQIVGYPILQLMPHRRDVRRYVRDLEEAMIHTLRHFGIEGIRAPLWPGVWVESNHSGLAKIAALGVHLSRWQTSHGFALNVNTDLSYFDLIVACGIREHGVTSMQRLLGHPLEMSIVEARLSSVFGSVFESEVRSSAPSQRTISVCLIASTPEPKVLLLHRRVDRGGFWQIVTGRVEADESPAEAASRELWEETGLHVPVQSLGYCHSFALGSKLPPRLVEEHAFAAWVESPQAVRVDPTEHDGLEWVSVEEALKRVPYPGLKRSVRVSANLPSPFGGNRQEGYPALGSLSSPKSSIK